MLKIFKHISIYLKMRGDQGERLVMLPFSLGCDSDTCVALGKKKQQQQLHPNKNKTQYHVAAQDHHHHHHHHHHHRITRKGGMMRRLRNIHRLILTTFSHLFVHKEEEEEEMEAEMEIGLPTDVKHVTHIGIGCWDGTTTMINHHPVDTDADAVKGKGWENAVNNMSFPSSSISLNQFELAMAAQAAALSDASNITA